jgi:lysine-specific histone demethylase 1B
MSIWRIRRTLFSVRLMHRRHFIRSLGALGLLSGIEPLLLAGCRKEDKLLKHSFDGSVVIIGAGAAGLYAAYVLKRLGIPCTVLEASGRMGGRMGKLEGFADFPIDLGAEWLHGRNSIMGDLATRMGERIFRDDSEDFYWLNGNITGERPQDIIAAYEAEDLPDVSYRAYAEQRGWLPTYAGIVEGLAGDQGASAQALSAFWSVKEMENWSSGDSDHRFKRTYYDLLHDGIAVHVQDRVLLNTPVERIVWNNSGVDVHTVNGGRHTAQKCIITVPVTVLREGDITFEPALPAEKTAAFGKLGMGPGMKVFLKFTQRFFRPFLVGGTVCAAYQDNGQGKDGSTPVLMAFVMGDQAAALHALGSDEAIVQALLAELDGMYAGQASASFVAAHVQNWTAMPFIRGAYSYSTVGMGDARAVAARPVGDTLFFAGEAMNTNGHFQTVHGAVETGYSAVNELLAPYR